MSHTVGKLSIEIKNVAIADTGDYEGVINVKDASGKLVFQIWGDEEADELRARRLVACWNACEGIDTQRLEDLGRPLREHLFGADDRTAELAKERDEALEALRECRLALEPYDDVKPRDWITDRENLVYAHRSARAILAKHQKVTG